MDIGVVGGGINGVMSAWVLARRGHAVTLFERGRLMEQTSAASTKLLHGGLRYLEHGAVRLVREGLRERQWWIDFAPDLCGALEIVVPIYEGGRRSGWIVGAGVKLYDWLAGRMALGRHRRLSATELLARRPDLRREGLRGGWSFYDGMMVDDAALGRRAAEAAALAGVNIREHSPVDRVGTDGRLWQVGSMQRYDAIVNAAGPWSATLLSQSGLSPGLSLDYVRGSHLILEHPCDTALLLEYPGEQRIFFVLPYLGGTLLGTTEIRQESPDPTPASDAEAEYLLRGYEHYFPGSPVTIRARFAGVRPLIRSTVDPSRASREYAIATTGRLLTIYGGKWTTARSLSEHVADRLPKA